MNKYADITFVLFSYNSKPLMCKRHCAMVIAYHDVGGPQTQDMRWVMMQVTKQSFVLFLQILMF
jgi:hypothetical protein